MAKITLTDLVNLQNETTAVNAINDNNAAIEAAFDNTLSRDGTIPNQMLAALDMNSNPILNIPAPVSNYSPIRLIDYQTLKNGGNVNVSPLPTGGTANQILTKNTSTDFDASWKTPSAAGLSDGTTGSGRVVLQNNPTINSPSLVTPSLGAATATTINGNTLTPGSYTLTGSANKTLNFLNSLTLAGTDGTTQTFPVASGNVITSASINAVTNGMLAQMPALTFKGNLVNATANAQDLTANQVKSALSLEQRTVVGDTNYSILTSDLIVATSTPFTTIRTWSLPTAASVNAGHQVIIDESAGAISFTNQLHIAATGPDHIFPNSSTLVSLFIPDVRVTFISDGVSKWAMSYTDANLSVTNPGYTSSGVPTSVLRTVRSKLGDTFAVTDFGAVGDNNPATAAANTLAIQNAITSAIQAGGAAIYFPRGTYYVNSELGVDGSNIEMVGDGPGITVIKTTSATSNIFRFGDGTNQRFRVGVRNMSFGTNATMTTGAAVLFNLVQDFWFEDWFTDSVFESCRMLGCTVGYIAHGYAINVVPTTGRGMYISGGNDQYMHDILITSNPAAQCRCGYEIESTGAVWMDSCGGLQCGTGLIALPTGSNIITWMFTTRCAMDTCSAHGWLLQANAGTSIKGWVSIGDWAASNAGNGITIAGSANSIVGLRLVGTRVINNFQHGIAVGTSAAYAAIQNALISTNGQAATNTYDGINVAAGVVGLQIQNCEIGNIFGAGWQQLNGINLLAGATDQTIIMGNNLNNNTNAITNLATGSNNIVEFNLPKTTDYIAVSVPTTSLISLTSTVATNFGSITLTPGTWDIAASVNFAMGTTTNLTRANISVSTASATTQFPAGGFADAFIPTTGLINSSSLSPNLVLPKYRLTVTSNTTIFLVGAGTFTVSTLQMWGIFSASRVKGA